MNDITHKIEPRKRFQGELILKLKIVFRHISSCDCRVRSCELSAVGKNGRLESRRDWKNALDPWAKLRRPNFWREYITALMTKGPKAIEMNIAAVRLEEHDRAPLPKMTDEMIDAAVADIEIVSMLAEISAAYREKEPNTVDCNDTKP